MLAAIIDGLDLKSPRGCPNPEKREKNKKFLDALASFDFDARSCPNVSSCPLDNSSIMIKTDLDRSKFVLSTDISCCYKCGEDRGGKRWVCFFCKTQVCESCERRYPTIFDEFSDPERHYAEMQAMEDEGARRTGSEEKKKKTLYEKGKKGMMKRVNWGLSLIGIKPTDTAMDSKK